MLLRLDAARFHTTSWVYFAVHVCTVYICTVYVVCSTHIVAPAVYIHTEAIYDNCSTHDICSILDICAILDVGSTFLSVCKLQRLIHMQVHIVVLRVVHLPLQRVLLVPILHILQTIGLQQWLVAFDVQFGRDVLHLHLGIDLHRGVLLRLVYDPVRH